MDSKRQHYENEFFYIECEQNLLCKQFNNICSNGNEIHQTWSRGEDTFLSKFKTLLQCPLFFARKKVKSLEMQHYMNTNRYTFYDIKNISVPQSTSLELPPSNATLMSQLEIPSKNRLLEKYLQQINQTENRVLQPLEVQDEAIALAEAGSRDDKEHDLNTENHKKILSQDPPKNTLDFFKQDSFIFGNMMVSRCQLAKCISLLSEVMEACEGKANEEMENEQTLYGKEIENKIKFCIHTLNSFDLYYYENCKLSSHSSTDGSKKLLKKQAENTNEQHLKNVAPITEPSCSKNMFSSYCDMNNLRDQINALINSNHHHEDCDECNEHYYETLKFGRNESTIYMNTSVLCAKKQVFEMPPLHDVLPTRSFSKFQNPIHCGPHTSGDAHSSNEYESISSSYIEVKQMNDRKSYNDLDLNLPFTPRPHNYILVQSNEDPIQKLFFETLVGKTLLPYKSSTRNLDCARGMMECDMEDNDKITKCNQCKSKNIGSKSYVLNQGVLPKDPLSDLEQEDVQLRVARWVMSIENYGLMEDHTSLENSSKGSEHQGGDIGTEDNTPRLTVRATQL